eukprot:scaffold36136_cov70-Phaeocystis_antarctica.AAC.1
MASTKGKHFLIPRLSLVLFGTFARKSSTAWSARDSEHLNTMHSGNEHERTACTGCGPAAYHCLAPSTFEGWPMRRHLGCF